MPSCPSVVTRRESGGAYRFELGDGKILGVELFADTADTLDPIR